MVTQIFDRRTIGIPGPIGDVTPDALAAKLAAEEARDQAQGARDEAEVFSASMRVLQDEAVADLQGDSASRTWGATSARLDESITVPASLTLSQMEVLARFPVREGGQSSWPQGVDINEQDREIYVVNVDGVSGAIRIDVRDLDTGARKSFKTFAGAPGAWTESLSWHRNGAGDLCFIVWPTVVSAWPNSAYAIANYTRGTLGDPVPIRGAYRAGEDQGRFITAWMDSTTIREFYVYDWDSVKAGAPVLIRRFAPDNPGRTAGKNQGVAALGSQVLVAHGGQGDTPSISAWGLDGRPAGTERWDRREFRTFLNAHFPGWLSGDAFFYESEGITSEGGRVYSAHIVGDVGSTAASQDMVIVRHGTAAGRRVRSTLPEVVQNTGWVDIPASALQPGWSIVGAGLRARIRAGIVEWEGALQNSSFVGGFTGIMQLTGDLAIFRAPSTGVYPVCSNTDAVRSVEVSASQWVRAYASKATPAWFYMSSVRYPAA